MRLFVVFLSLLNWGPNALGNNSALLQAELDGVAAYRASQIHAVYQGLKRLGIPNQDGHTMAAGRLTACIGDRTVQDQVLLFDQTLKALSQSRLSIIRFGARDLAPQITYTAATLVCRMGTRTPPVMVGLLEGIYQALLHDGYVNWLPNVVTAAHLVGLGIAP